MSGIVTKSDFEEVLKFVRASLGLALHVKEDVGLCLHDGVLISQCHSAVVEMEPATFMLCICCVMSRTDPARKKSKIGENHKRICAAV